MSPDSFAQLVRAREIVRRNSDRLRNLQFKMSGAVHDSLTEAVGMISSELEDLADHIENLGGRMVGEAFREAEESSRNMLEAAIAGVQIATRDRKGTP